MVWALQDTIQPNNTILFVTIDKFDPNPMLVNMNKLRPYMFIEDRILQPILVKPSDLVIDEPIQTKELDSQPTELKDFQPIELKPICIKGIDVVVHHYHNVLVQDNDVTGNND